MTRIEVLMWARRICAMRNAEPHAMLDISPEASIEQAQTAFYDLARVAHPDLHRTTATPAELELITTAFSLVAAGYHHFRGQRLATTKITAIPRGESGPIPKSAAHAKFEAKSAVTAVTGPHKPSAAAELVPERAPAPTPQMSPRALIHYRKAELSLRRGDLPSSVLHLKMAIGIDPQSAFLRQALKEVEAALAKK